MLIRLTYSIFAINLTLCTFTYKLTQRFPYAYPQTLQA